MIFSSKKQRLSTQAHAHAQEPLELAKTLIKVNENE
jgi:hypothetical protein